MAQKTKPASVPITVIDMVDLEMRLTGLKNSGLSSATFIKFLDFQHELEAIITRYRNDVKTLMLAYGVKLINNPLTNKSFWDYERSPSKVEIKTKLEHINSQPCQISTTHFIPDSEFYEVTKKLDMSDIAVMARYLRVKKP